MLKIRTLTMYDNLCNPLPNYSSKTTADGWLDR